MFSIVMLSSESGTITKTGYNRADNFYLAKEAKRWLVCPGRGYGAPSVDKSRIRVLCFSNILTFCFQL